MKKIFLLSFGLGFLFILYVLLMPYQAVSCSTFKLQKGGCLIYGHNLNQGDLDVPGLIFINKRDVDKLGVHRNCDFLLHLKSQKFVCKERKKLRQEPEIPEL